MHDGVDLVVAQHGGDGRVAGVGADEFEAVTMGDRVAAAVSTVDRLERAQVAADHLGAGERRGEVGSQERGHRTADTGDKHMTHPDPPLR